MAISAIYLIVCLIEHSNSQWIISTSMLSSNSKFTKQTGIYAYYYSGNFLLPSTYTTANFITCTTPAISYITLSSTYPSAQTYSSINFRDGDYVSIDLFFQGTWLSENVQFTIGSFSYTYSYTSPSDYQIITGFCDNLPFQVRTVNFTIVSSGSAQITFTSSNINTGLVSLRNIFISNLQIICYPSCDQCTGPNQNECTSCYYDSPINNICPPCPSNLYYWKEEGCKNICDIQTPLYQNGFCQQYPTSSIMIMFILMMQNGNQYMTNKMQIHHQKFFIMVLKIYTEFNSGIYKLFKNLNSYYQATYLIGLKISVISFNDIIYIVNKFLRKIYVANNNTYFGSIYRNASGVQTHKLTISDSKQYNNAFSTYSSTTRYVLITYVDIPKYSFLFSAIGNYTDDLAGWGLSQIQITSGYCPEKCLQCEHCEYGYYIYRDGKCRSYCSSPYQKQNWDYCQDYDDETPYSQYLIQEYTNAATDPEQYAQYTLISQNGTNFLKGSDIYYSYQSNIRVFGGPFVWAQAKFQRIHNILSPHHSVTIAFYIVYGPSFPSNGEFIYQIENKTPISKSSNNSNLINSDGSKYDKVYEKINHNTNTLTITWECFGPNNEPVYAYCGFYNYYIAVHNCQPYCLQCSNQTKCTLWNSTYNANIVKFSQAECMSYQYYDKESLRCLNCPSSCLTCTSKIDCKTCKTTYMLSKLGCICKINQYEDQNQCLNCPIECSQCLSLTYCLECLNSNKRQLLNGQCNCIDGYYPIVSNPQCQLCHQFCKTCYGPTSNECLTCNNNIISIEQIGSTCRCQTGSAYMDVNKACFPCHSSCLTCFRTTIDGCLTCNSSQNRQLKGLKCRCASGYYESINSCTNCPNTENTSLSQCYKQCNNNQKIWHTITCSLCDSGYHIVSGECQPICGDLQIKEYEQCEDSNTGLNDLCFNCQFQCPSHCLTCDQSTNLPCPDVCGDGIITGIEECEDGNTIQYDGCFNCKYQCQPSCTNCIRGNCFECLTAGWYIDITVTPWQCKELCGDFMIVGSEQCEDGNLQDTDGCKDCKFFCRIGCSSCDYTINKCLSCELAGFVPKYYYCDNVCGDGLVVTDPSGINSEECDDRNTNNNDGCNNLCQFQCQTSCASCINNRCAICADGYLLTNEKICIAICGDLKRVLGEQCDNSPYKSCINCQIKCQSTCIDCDTTGLGCLKCKTGYNNNDYICQSICGDQIVTNDEQCDDGNLIIGDGCHFCQYSCQDSCLNCIQGVCYNCKEGFELIQSKCYAKCGDGIQNDKEQCEMIKSLHIYQSCKSCVFTCDLNCQLCQFGRCQKCTKEYELSSNQYYCIKSLQYNSKIVEHCQIQVQDNCIQCKNYAYFDKVEQKCNLKEKPLSFCQYQFKLSPDLYCSYCFEYCATCNENNCISCQSGYYLGDNFSCISSCGDGILAHDEKCEIDDQNCLSCMFEVSNQCELYFEDHCYRCEQGFYINQYTNICESNCGDGIITFDEDCEDNNYKEYDGCYYCKYSCSQQCLNCIKGVCQECNKNYYLWDGFCYGEENEIDQFPQCKEYVNGQCLMCQKDYNLNEYGDCISECQKSCIQCYDGQCFQCAELYELYENICILPQQCQTGLQFNQELQICESLCGDGFINGWEECDDQNMEQFDGCYQCRYECDDKCIQCIYGECFKCSQEFNLSENKCLSKCQETCLYCFEGVCQLCSNGYFLNEYLNCIKISCEYNFSCTSFVCGNGIIEELEQCDDQNLINDDNCNNQCEQNCDINCTNCIDGVCYECKEGWRLSLSFCDSICGDQIIVRNEECDDGNQIAYDGCFKCQFQSTQYYEIFFNGICQSCQSNYELDQLNNSSNHLRVTQLQIVLEQLMYFCQVGYLDLITNTCIIEQNINKCSQNCKQCLLSQCLECEFGYYGNKCMPKCGDGILVQQEECDDGNLYELDSCLNCKYQCPQNCNQCAYGICIHCFFGFYLDIVSNSCHSVCGDNMLATDEICDDDNEQRYDGCFQCNFQCQIECLNCEFGKCIECQSPLVAVQSKGICEELNLCDNSIGLYQNDYSNDCLPLCGDSIVAGNEQCEDQNNIPYDGCYECQIQCQIGFSLQQNSCIPICGDGIVINEYENCDDQNDQPYDGCFECQFQCTQNCLICSQGTCLQCDIDYSFENNKCLLKKQNDDPNSTIINQSQKKNDSILDSQNSQLELLNENKICQQSECVYSQKPSIRLNFKNQSFTLQYVQITFDQEVKFSKTEIQDQQLFNLSIIDLAPQNYNITVNSIQMMSLNLQYAQYLVAIEIFIQLQTKPVLLVLLNQGIVNSNNQTIINPNESITLQSPKIISKQLKSISVKVKESNQAFMIGAISICLISFLSGESQIIVETLNLLQYQSFLRFINVEYPENLQIYFQAYDLLSITYYFQVFEIDDYLNIITGQKKQLDLTGKFKEYNVDADLFKNILPQFIQFLGLVTLPFFAKTIYKIFSKLCYYMRKFQHEKTLTSQILIALINLILGIRQCIKQLMKIRYQQKYDLIRQLIYINSWDLLFKVILQLHYNKIDNLRSILTSYFTLLIFFICIGFQLKSLSIFSSHQFKNLKARLEIKFITLDIFRTMFFHIVLVFFQEEYILQTLLISVSNLSQCYLIYKYKQCSKLDKIIFLLVEGILTLFSLSLFFYFDTNEIYMTYENKVVLGFFQMSFLILSLATVFGKDLFSKVLNIYKLINKKKQVPVANNQLFYF